MVWIWKKLKETRFVASEIYDLGLAEENAFIGKEIWLKEELKSGRISKEALWKARI